MEPANSKMAPQACPPSARSPGDDDAFLARLEAVAKATFYSPGLRALGPEGARRLIALTVTLARGRGLDDLRLGEGLAALKAHDIRLGYACIGDLAREELGLDAAHARWLMGMAVKLAARPLLRAAVVSGELSLRKADAVADAAVGEHEAYWVERARHDTVVALEAAAKPGATPPEFDWRLFDRYVAPEHRECVQLAFTNAATVLGNPDAPLGQRIAVLSMEWLGEFPLPEDGAGPAAPRGSPEALAVAKAAVQQAEQPGEPAAAAPPAPPDAPALTWPLPVKPRKLLRELKHLVKDRIPDDERLGRACVLVKAFSTWKVAGCRGFEAFCLDKLGLAPSTVRQRMKLEGAMRALPPLRAALRSGKLSYEQARSVAKVATPANVAERIEATAAKPCIDTQRETQEEVDRQMWRKGRVRAAVSATTDELVAAAMRSVQLWAGRPTTPSEELYVVAAYFNMVWLETALIIEQSTHPVMKAARGRCQVPGCSHRATHLHHVIFRSHGGGNGRTNLVAVCAAHHLAGIHQGYVKVTGSAPDALVWEFPGRTAPETLDADQRAVEGTRVAA